MTKHDVLEALEAHFATFAPRDSGNLVARDTASRLVEPMRAHRHAVVGALAELLSHRAPHEQRTQEDARAEARLWIAASVAEDLSLVELIPDLERLIADVQAGRTMTPVHAETLRNHLNALREIARRGE